MNKKSFILSFVMVFLPLLLNARKIEIDGIWYNLVAKANQAEVTYGSKEYSGDITIPSAITYEGVEYSVTSIGDFAFEGSSSVTSIIIPHGVKRIGDNAFLACRGLTSINFPEGVISIGNDVFNSCSSLKSIILPKSLQEIGLQAFVHCSELQNVYCYPEEVPLVDSNIFKGSLIEYSTLHVPSKVIEDYQTTIPWSDFGQILPLDVVVSDIIFDRMTISLMEGESTTITAVLLPNDASNQALTWNSSNEDVAMVNNKGRVIAISEGTATITAKANDGSEIYASCELIVKSKPIGKCATPIINYTDSKFLLTCNTEGAEVITTVVPENEMNYQGLDFDFTPTCTFMTYATKDKYEDSDTACITLCWIPCVEKHEKESDEETSIITIPSTAVLIKCHEGTLVLNGLADGTEVAVYDIAGRKLTTDIVINGKAMLETKLMVGDAAVIMIGKNRIKIVIK